MSAALSAHGKVVCSKALSRKGAFHDITSTTHDRRYAGENLSSQTQATYVQQVSLFARHFNKSPEILGPEEIRSYQVYLTNEKKLAPSSIIIAVAALRFLYKVTLRKDWRLEEIIPTPKKPQKLPNVLSPEEVLRFLACVRNIKHRTILTTCYAAGLRVSEAICLKVTDIDSERMVIRIRQGKGQKCPATHFCPYVAFPLVKPITPHSLRHYPEFQTIQGKLKVSAPNPLLTGLGAASVCSKLGIVLTSTRGP